MNVAARIGASLDLRLNTVCDWTFQSLSGEESKKRRESESFRSSSSTSRKKVRIAPTGMEVMDNIQRPINFRWNTSCTTRETYVD